MPRTITVASQKGGVGKTTTVVNLAATLAAAGRPVLLVDLDPQANATSGVGLSRSEAKPHFLSALLEQRPLGPFIAETRIPGLAAIPSSAEVADLSIIQRLLKAPAVQLRHTLALAAEDYQYVLIDCPPSLEGPPSVALSLSDSVIVPVQCEYYAMEGLSQILPVIQNIRDRHNPSLRIEGLLLTMFSPELELSRDVADEVSTYFSDTTFRAIVPRDVTLAEASSHGRPAIDYAPESRGAWAYVELAREVMQHGEA